MNTQIEKAAPSFEVIRHPNPHVLRAEVTRMARRGEVRQRTLVYTDSDGQAAVVVDRLR